MAILNQSTLTAMHYFHRQIRRLATLKQRIVIKCLCVLWIGYLNPFFHPVTLADNPTQHQVKVAFIYNFISFTKWPEGTPETLNLCIHGQDPFGGEFNALQDKISNGRKINIMRIGNSMQFESCQVIFFPRSSTEVLSSLLDKIGSRPVLTIADSPGAAARGVIINMSLSDAGRVVFEINQRAALNAELGLSSKLLSLAVTLF